MGQKQSQVQITEYDKAMLQLKGARDQLQQHHRRIEFTQTRCVTVAKLLLKKGKKYAALLVIKKKKMQERSYEQAAHMLFNVEQLIINLDQQTMNRQVYQAMSNGNNALKTLNNLLSVEDVENLLVDTHNEIGKVDKLSDALNTFPTSLLNVEDYREIEDEFEKLITPEIHVNETIDVTLKDTGGQKNKKKERRIAV